MREAGNGTARVKVEATAELALCGESRAVSPGKLTQTTLPQRTRGHLPNSSPPSPRLPLVKMKIHRMKGVILLFAFTNGQLKVFVSKTMTDERETYETALKYCIYRIMARRRLQTRLIKQLNCKSPLASRRSFLNGILMI